MTPASSLVLSRSVGGAQNKDADVGKTQLYLLEDCCRLPAVGVCTKGGEPWKCGVTPVCGFKILLPFVKTRCMTASYIKNIQISDLGAPAIPRSHTQLRIFTGGQENHVLREDYEWCTGVQVSTVAHSRAEVKSVARPARGSLEDLSADRRRREPAESTPKIVTAYASAITTTADHRRREQQQEQQCLHQEQSRHGADDWLPQEELRIGAVDRNRPRVSDCHIVSNRPSQHIHRVISLKGRSWGIYTFCSLWLPRRGGLLPVVALRPTTNLGSGPRGGPSFCQRIRVTR